jgi:beta-phosphoglucomutase-like phosphatase (HAD superfamily)
MEATKAATVRRTFWWDRAGSAVADVPRLRAVVFDADTVLGEADGDGDLVPKAGLIDLIMSLFVEGVWVAVVSRRDRESAHALVRQLVGDGLVETIVSADDLDRPGSDSELYRLALWELGVKPESALAVGGSAAGLRAAHAAGLPTVPLTSDYTGGRGFADAAGCRLLHQRWGKRSPRHSHAA